MVSGHEAVMVTVQAPSGTKSLLPLVLDDGVGRYTATLTCSEVRCRVDTATSHIAAITFGYIAVCTSSQAC